MDEEIGRVDERLAGLEIGHGHLPLGSFGIPPGFGDLVPELVVRKSLTAQSTLIWGNTSYSLATPRKYS